MNGARLVVSLLLVAVPALALPVVRKTGKPKQWAIVLTAALGTGFVLVEASLIHAALPAVFTLAGWTELAAACRALGGHLFGANPAFAIVALAAAASGLWLAVLSGLRTIRTNASLRQGVAHASRTAIGGHNATLVPLFNRWAMALPGPSPQILISDTLVAKLQAAELKAVVRHEAAHLRHHHLRFVLLGAVVGAGLWFLPWSRRATRVQMLALERWADEEASSGSTEEREQVRSALRKLSQLAPSALAGDRITALDTTDPDHHGRADSNWWAAAWVVMPLALGLAVTLAYHLVQVVEVASSG